MAERKTIAPLAAALLLAAAAAARWFLSRSAEPPPPRGDLALSPAESEAVARIAARAAAVEQAQAESAPLVRSPDASAPPPPDGGLPPPLQLAPPPPAPAPLPGAAASMDTRSASAVSPLLAAQIAGPGIEPSLGISSSPTVSAQPGAQGPKALAAPADGDEASAAPALPTQEASALLSRTRAILSSLGGASASMRAQRALAAALIDGVERDHRVETRLRSALARLGPDASDEQRANAAAAVLRSERLDASPEAALSALARASAPLRPFPSQEKLSAAAADIVSHPPDPATVAEVVAHENDPPQIMSIPEGDAPDSPPPPNAIAAYRRYQGVLDQAQEQYGVAPSVILGILSVESDFGADTGRKPLVPVLLALAQSPSAPKRAQAASDLKSLTLLAARGDLGGKTPSQMVGNYAGAYGPPQFLASSQLAYGRSADGGGTNLYSLPNSIMSVANYLKMNGYDRSVSGSIFRYNHSQDYVNLVLNRSRRIAAAIKSAPPSSR